MSEYIEGIGRRKEASARVRIYLREAGQEEGPSFIVNDKPVQEFFPRYGDYQILVGPLEDSGRARVRSEWFAFFDAECGKLTVEHAVAVDGRFGIDDVMKQFPVIERALG